MAAFVSNPHATRLAAEARLSALRAKLREMYAARKLRMKEFVEACRADRLALREHVREMRKRSLDHLREQVSAARGSAKLVRMTRLAEIRQAFGADVQGARAALEVERQHQAELMRIAREEEARRREIQRAHDQAMTAGHVRSALIGKLGPFFEKEARTIVHAPGESRGEALLRHAEKHAHKAYAIVDPQSARHVEETERAVAEAEREVRRVGGNSFVPPARPPAVKPSGAGGADPSVRRKGALPRSGGVALDDLMRERDELKVAQAKRTAAKGAGGKPALVSLPSPAAANANAQRETPPESKGAVSSPTAPRERRTESDVKAPELHDTAEIAQRIRADIQEAVKAKQLPKATYSVRTSKYSMGSSIDVVASKLPFPVLNAAAFHLEPGSHEVSFDRSRFASRYTPEAEAVLAKLNAIVDAYHWDRSDSASDYYNERFARDVKLDPGSEWARINAQKGGRDVSPKGKPTTPARARPMHPKKTAAAKPPSGRPAPVAAPAASSPASPTRPTKTGARRPTRRSPSKAQQTLDTDSPLFANAPRFAGAVVPAASAYEQKKAARVERLRARSAKLHAEAEGAFSRQRQIGDRIAFGQPILVGHHSEKRHRRDLGRINALMGKGVALSKKADALARRADAADKNAAISSDDPDALEKLRAKLTALERSRERMRAANLAIRKGGEVVPRLVALGFSATAAATMLQKDAIGHVGFPAYRLQNTAAEERRVRERIAQLEARAATPARPDETVGGAVISEADNRVRIAFPSKPAESLRRALKSAGFRWSPTSNAWQRFASTGAWTGARRILGETIPHASTSTTLPTPPACP